MNDKIILFSTNSTSNSIILYSVWIYGMWINDMIVWIFEREAWDRSPEWTNENKEKGEKCETLGSVILSEWRCRINNAFWMTNELYRASRKTNTILYSGCIWSKHQHTLARECYYFGFLLEKGWGSPWFRMQCDCEWASYLLVLVHHLYLFLIHKHQE
jgi:hypothetical protein